MAIQKMKKLRLMVHLADKDELLHELILCGFVELSEPSGELKERVEAGELRRTERDVRSLELKLNSLCHASGILDKYVPVKKRPFSSLPHYEQRVFLDDTGLRGALRAAGDIEDSELRIKNIDSECARQRELIASLEPWLGLDMSLSTAETERCAVLIGSVPARFSPDTVSSELEQLTDELGLYLVSGSRKENNVLVVCMKELLPEVQSCLRRFDFAPSPLAGMKGTPKECRFNAEESIRRLEADRQDCLRYISGEAVHREEIRLAADRTAVALTLARAEQKICSTGTTACMEGWFPAEKERRLAAVLARFDCAWESAEPAPEEYPDVPVKLINNKFSDALNTVTEMYSLPAYGTVDPNPLMAPYFILFYGLMMADMGYGLIMILAALCAMAFIRPKESKLSFCRLLLYCGISTFIMGALTGGFFGNALEQIGRILGKSEGWGVLPCLFSPLEDSVGVLIGCLILGLLHLNTGMAISFACKWKNGHRADAFWEEGTIWLMLAGIVLYLLKIGFVGGYPVPLIVSVLLVFWGGSRKAKGLGKLTSVFSTLYNTATGWLGDILSYSRIMALMLAGSAIAMVFNTIGALADNIVFFFVIFIFGHALNFALNMLGCFVHDLRLQCLEYFGKFYKDGGRPFRPLRVETKYHNSVQ